MNRQRMSLAVTMSALAGLVLWAGLRERVEAGRPIASVRAAAAAKGEPDLSPPPAARPLDPEVRETDSFFPALREAGAEMRQLQARRQLEWAVEVDQQTRLEWTERYDAERQALLERLQPFAAGLPREILDDFDTWASAQREYGKP